MSDYNPDKTYLSQEGFEELVRLIRNGIDFKSFIAGQTATNYIEWVPGEGLLVGDKREGEWNGTRTRMDNDSFDILNQNGEVLASYGQEAVIKTKIGDDVYFDNTEVTIDRTGLNIKHEYSDYPDLSADEPTVFGEYVHIGTVNVGHETPKLAYGIGMGFSEIYAESDGTFHFHTDNDDNFNKQSVVIHGVLSVGGLKIGDKTITELPTAITNQRIDEICV